MEQVFGEHVHWGYWENPKLADGSIEDFQNATRALSKKLLALANIVNGQNVLEVGCGFGGTISIINELFKNLKIVGLNIFQVSVFIFYISMGKILGGTAPILTEGVEVYSNPLPHVLILTAIVVGVATTALGLALVVSIKKAYGSIEDDEIHKMEDDT